MEQRLLTLKQAAKYLGIKDTKCSELLRGENGLAVKVGNRWHADKVALDEWIEANRK